jgi:UDP-2,3-diacylglucosamine pyrophosphatase LpxH
VRGWEAEILEQIARESPELILVASDLHMGPGVDAATGEYDPRDNFLADNAFVHWLAHYRDEAARGALLILNGDIFDFIRITRIPRTREDFTSWGNRLARIGRQQLADSLARVAESPDHGWKQARRRYVSRREELFGLRADDFKTVWKLHVISEGHEGFFRALAGWVGAGGRVVFTKGNHDVELHWLLVRVALRDEILSSIIGADVEAMQERIAFADLGFTLSNLWIEHGHRFESMTSVLGGEVLADDPTELNLPIGSFINRYFLNRFELSDPLIDNVEPSHKAVLDLLRRRPLLMVAAYPRAFRFAWRALRIKKGRVASTAVARMWGVLAFPIVAVVLYAAYVIWRDAFLPYPWWQTTLALGAVFLLPATIPYLLRALDLVRGSLGAQPEPDPMLDCARSELLIRFGLAEDAPEQVYAVIAHRHRQEVTRLEPLPGGTEAYYANSGTWIPLWPYDRPDLQGRVIHSYLAFTSSESGEYRHRSLIWDHEAGAVRNASW